MINPLIIICGVSGCGKSTVGRALSEQTGWRFIEGDDHHPANNIAKMSSGEPLTDDDRTGWLENICDDVQAHTNGPQILACSALTSYVQDFLNDRLGDRIVWVKLDITKETAQHRMSTRDHFMPPELMESQFAAWSAPKGGLSVSAAQPLETIIDTITAYLAET